MAKGPPRSREEALKIFLMSCIADDYEELKVIFATIGKWAEEDSLHFDTREILDQLSVLIRENHAQAYILSPHPPHVVRADYSDASVNDLWFMLTVSGRQALNELGAP